MTDEISSKQLLDDFSKTLDRFDSDSSESAVKALAEVFELAYPMLSASDRFSGFFPSHAVLHVTRLMSILSELLIAFQNGEGEQKIDRDILLLTAAAIVFHDVGMGIGAKDHSDPKEFVEWYWREHGNRDGHDQRSLTFVEENLALNGADKIISWLNYWKATDSDDKVGDRVAVACLVARICQSHGDSDDSWLILNELRQYPLQTPELKSQFGGDIYKFFEEWVEPENIRRGERLLCAASCLLSLCDLCDIARERFPDITDDKVLKKLALPNADSPKRLESYFHWISHYLGSIKFNEESHRIEYKLPNSLYFNSLRWLLFFNKGPVAYLYDWGNRRILLKTLETYLPLKFEGVELKRVGRKIDDWKEVESKATFWSLDKTQPFTDVNKVLLQSQHVDDFDRLFTFPLLLKWTLNPHEASLSRAQPSPEFANQVLKLREEGLLLEQCFEPCLTDGIRDKRVLALTRPEYEQTQNGNKDFLFIDTLIAALGMVGELMTVMLDHTIVPLRLELVATKSRKIVNLCDPSIPFPTNTVFLIVVEEFDGPDTWRYKEIVRRMKELINVGVIFIVQSAESDQLKELTETIVVPKIRNEACEILANGKSEIALAIRPGVGVNDLNIDDHSSPSRVVYQIYQHCIGSKALTQRLRNLAQGRTDENNNSLVGITLFLTALELLSIDPGEPDLKPGVKSEELLAVINPLVRELNISDFDMRAVLNDIQTHGQGLVIEIEPDCFQVKDHVELADVLTKIVPHSSLCGFTQLLVLYYLQSASIVYNTSSPLFDQNLAVIPFSAAVFRRFLSDDNTSLRIREWVAFGLAEALSKRLSEETGRLWDFFDELMAETDDLESTTTDMVVFQMMYRTAKSQVANVPLLERLVNRYEEKSIVLLGVLEALASAGHDSQMQLLAKVIGLIAAKEEEFPQTAMMAYDILWHYDQSDGTKYSELRSRFGRATVQGWDDICKYYHKLGKEPEWKSPEVKEAWESMRKAFTQVIVAEPEAYKRADSKSHKRADATKSQEEGAPIV